MSQHHAHMDDTVLNRKEFELFYFLIFLYVSKCDPNLTKKGTKNNAKQCIFSCAFCVFRSLPIRFSTGAFLATELLSCRDFVHGI